MDTTTDVTDLAALTPTRWRLGDYSPWSSWSPTSSR